MKRVFAASGEGVEHLQARLLHIADALPSWNDGMAKQSIVDFVAKVT